MQDELLNELLKITEEEEIILQNRREIKKELYTNQSNFIIESEKFLSKDKMIMVRQHTRFVDFPKHKHNYIEINYVYNGELNQKVGNQKINLKQGELLFLNQHIEHEIAACATEDIIINFIIQPQFFDFIFSFLTTENRISNFLINSLYNSTQNGQFLYFKVSEVKSIQALIKKIIIEIMSSAFMSDSTVKLYMGLLIVELIKHADKAEHTEDYPVQHYLIVESLKYIDENFQKASLYELSSQLNQPHYALSKEIKKATNYTFKELLQEKRLSKAKELLESTNMPITTIIEQVGYDNVSYFYRIFKNKYNQTPKQFREHLAKK
ncbi:helix-turn-helix domain-containing protein [Priestia filamentosa]|uniref:AraC family transcriptional regulator n=2 Tax=Priestia filamentosa TaxID=1402861 RepID=UPI001FB3DF1A|nr:AraC family transcriptional regulator [Priestia filamentosa]MED3729273.1 AraC family transcriptional regulator [Priestia filamentosa]UOE59160.1 helix-turn-helix domain-containing protein [Priestia filamentosa]